MEGDPQTYDCGVSGAGDAKTRATIAQSRNVSEAIILNRT